jgi:hypothetical protein
MADFGPESPGSEPVAAPAMLARHGVGVTGRPHGTGAAVVTIGVPAWTTSASAV